MDVLIMEMHPQHILSFFQKDVKNHENDTKVLTIIVFLDLILKHIKNHKMGAKWLQIQFLEFLLFSLFFWKIFLKGVSKSSYDKQKDPR